MKLSEAIRKGCKISEYGCGTYISRETERYLGSDDKWKERMHVYACALGAAALAIDPQLKETPSGDVENVLRVNWRTELFDPRDPRFFGPLADEIIGRSDDAAADGDVEGSDPRVEIADWLAEKGL